MLLFYTHTNSQALQHRLQTYDQKLAPPLPDAEGHQQLPGLPVQLGTVGLVHSSSCVPHAVHDCRSEDQQEVPQPLGADHGTDQPLPTDGAETPQKGGANLGQQCPALSRGPS